jgi:hypothetical protein
MTILNTTDGRDALIWACHLWNTSPNFALNLLDIKEDEKGPNWSDVKTDALVATNDPAKLAELIAIKLRQSPLVAIRVCKWKDVVMVRSRYMIGYRRESRVRTMPQSRAILLALLQRPDGAPREDVEMVLRGEK